MPCSFQSCTCQVERPCGHAKDFDCKQLVQLLKQQEIKGNCAVMQERPLRCGHMARETCRKFQDYEDGKVTIKCTQKRTTECWNAAACQSKRLVVDCAESRKVCCDKAIPWTCENSLHTLNLKLCKEGIPSECPSCSGDRLSAAIEDTKRSIERADPLLPELHIFTSWEKTFQDRLLPPVLRNSRVAV